MKVVNKYKEKYTHYIGRGSIFGNPFSIGKDGTREEVIQKYENYLRKWMYNRAYFKSTSCLLGNAVWRLPEDAILGCYCKPKACHGDIIIKIWRELHEKE